MKYQALLNDQLKEAMKRFSRFEVTIQLPFSRLCEELKRCRQFFNILYKTPY